MDDYDAKSSPADTKCVVGPFGRFLPVQSLSPEWLYDPPHAESPDPRSRYTRSEPVEMSTALRFGTDTSILGQNQRHCSTTPSPPHSMASSEPDVYRERTEFYQIPTPHECYPASMTTCSTRSSTASPVESGYGRRRRHSDETSYHWLPRPDLTAIAPGDSASFSLAMYMASSRNDSTQFSPASFDLTKFESSKLAVYPVDDLEQSSGNYHQSRLPFIPGLAPISIPNTLGAPEGDFPVNLPPISPLVQKHFAYVVEERVFEGEGLCYVYSDGSHCPKFLNGEPVNVNWGVTKAGKPRKRLAQACLTCRSKKTKCIPNFPKCEQCQRSGRHCRYENAVRRNSSKATNRPVMSQPTEKIRLLNATEPQHLPNSNPLQMDSDVPQVMPVSVPQLS